MNVPDEIRDKLKVELWRRADEIDWLALGSLEKSQRYENWAHETTIGGMLAHYMDVRQIRLYIKDTLLKKYPQTRLADAAKPLGLLAIPASTSVVTVFTRPHGRRLSDGRIVCWGRANDWKSVLMAAHERAFRQHGARPHGVVLLQSSMKFGTNEAREVVIDAGRKLGIETLIWDG